MEQHRIWDHFQSERVDSFDHARGRYAAMRRLVRAHVPRGAARVLNIGIGSGRLERLLRADGLQVSALDPGGAAVAALRADGVDARVGLAQEMPFEAAQFDAVVASEVLEHLVPDVRARALADIARVLRPGGWFLGSVPYREVLADQEVICPDCGKVFHRWGHVASFDLPDLQAELEAWFEAVRCRRLSFVDWQRARAPLPLAKAVVQSLLGRLGEPIASPSIRFAARRRGAA